MDILSYRRVLLWVKRCKEFGEIELDERRGKTTIMDLHTKEIISYKFSTSLGLEFVEEMLTQAFSKEKVSDLKGLIIHNDQGFHYTSCSYKEILRKNNIIQSMSIKGNCYDNACIENFFEHLKSELIYLTQFKNKEDLFDAIDTYIYWYNNERFQLGLKSRAPIEARSAA